MKYMIIPEQPILLETIEGEPLKGQDGKPLKAWFKDFILGRLRDPHWGEDSDRLLIAAEIKKAARKIEPTNTLFQLENDQHKHLKEVTMHPSEGAKYRVEVAVCLMPFINAVLEAKSEPPAVAALDEETPDTPESSD